MPRKVPLFRVMDTNRQQQHFIRRICVVDSQPFYQSSGDNSFMDGVWLPFEKFDVAIPKITGSLRKPNLKLDDLNNKRNLFPKKIADVFDTERIEWQRFKNMKCLFISYLLSGNAMSRALRKEIKDYIGSIPHETLVLDHSVVSDCFSNFGIFTEIKSSNFDALNNKLRSFGAVLDDTREDFTKQKEAKVERE
ncbi:MAG TPA: hypothetical protein VHD33_03085, partial [Legionellaceae bacterium]|nr:hypothetical protein [Legionellaceae bacterium]